MKKEIDEWGYEIVRPSKEADSEAKPTDDEIIMLLRQIERNTSATHFWTRVVGIPVLIGMILGFAKLVE